MTQTSRPTDNRRLSRKKLEKGYDESGSWFKKETLRAMTKRLTNEEIAQEFDDNLEDIYGY